MNKIQCPKCGSFIIRDIYSGIVYVNPNSKKQFKPTYVESHGYLESVCQKCKHEFNRRE